MKVPQLDLAAQHGALGQEFAAAIYRVLASGRFILGREVEALESELAAYTGAAHAISCASGTDALLLALLALDVGPGDEVITSPFTFIAAAGVIHRLGARPAFVDIDPRTYGLDAEQVARRINSRTRAILPVHLFGRVAEMEPILQIGRNCHIPVVEDAAQAIGARLDGRMAGTFGAIGCYSFYPTKNLGGAGDGGLVVTGDARLAARIRRLRVHGQDGGRYRYSEVGINSRLDELQAAVLRVKLPRLEEWNRARRQKAGRYTARLLGVVETPDPGPEGAHVFHQYVIRCADRDRLQQRLAGSGVETAVYYPEPLHLQQCFRYLGYKSGDFPQAEEAAKTVLSLPIYPELTEQAQDHVIGAVREWAKARPDREVMNVHSQ
jgi:dTDP-4-amino-4,6-dideoxygalactose transaminase